MGKQLRAGNRRLGCGRVNPKNRKKTRTKKQFPRRLVPQIFCILDISPTGGIACCKPLKTEKPKKQKKQQKPKKTILQETSPPEFCCFFVFLFFGFFGFSGLQHAIPPVGPYIQYEDESISKQRPCFKSMLL